LYKETKNSLVTHLDKWWQLIMIPNKYKHRSKR